MCPALKSQRELQGGYKPTSDQKALVFFWRGGGASACRSLHQSQRKPDPGGAANPGRGPIPAGWGHLRVQERPVGGQAATITSADRIPITEGGIM